MFRYTASDLLDSKEVGINNQKSIQNLNDSSKQSEREDNEVHKEQERMPISQAEPIIHLILDNEQERFDQKPSDEVRQKQAQELQNSKHELLIKKKYQSLNQQIKRSEIDVSINNSKHPLSQRQASSTSPTNKKDQVNRLSRKLSEAHYSCQQAQFQNIQLRNRIERVSIKMDQQYRKVYLSEIQSKEIELRCLQQEAELQKDNFKLQLMDKNKRIKQLQSENNKKTREVSKLQQQIKNNINQRILLKQKMQQLIREDDQLNKKTQLLEDKLQKTIRQKQAQSNDYLKQIRQLHRQSQISCKKIEELNLSIKNIKMAKQKMESELKQSNKLKTQLATRLSKLQQERKQMISSKQKLTQELHFNRKKNQQLQAKVKELADIIAKISRDQKQLSEKVTKLNAQKQNNLEEIDRLQNELTEFKVEQTALLAYKKQVNISLNSINSQLQLPPIHPKNTSQKDFQQVERRIFSLKYFQDSLILSKASPSKKQFIVGTLKEFMGCNQVKAQLVYRLDPLNPTNFHQYFDNKENLLIIVELTNGAIIGGFTKYPYDQHKTQRPGRGLLLNITDEKAYRQRPDPKQAVATYDSYFYILGNAEIRIKVQQRRVFSNFGIANSTFDNRNDPRTGFLKVKETSCNQVQLNSYEFYQIRPAHQ